MQYIKKLSFAPIFLIRLLFLLSLLSSLFRSYDFIFSLSLDTFFQLLTLSLLLGLVSISFVIFAALCNDWRFVVPVGILAALSPFLFFDPSLVIVFGIGILISILLIFVNLENVLKTYLTFQPAAILGPSIRHLTTLLILIISLTYFLSINKTVSEKGFSIPDSLIDTALKFTPLPEPMEEESSIPNLSISSDQIALLKQNPNLLEQFGLDPSVLDSLNQPQKTTTPKDLTQSLLKEAVKAQFDNLIKPYASFIAPLLAVMLFLTLQALSSFVNLLIYPVLWIIFYIFERTGFVKFIEETRVVKKLVI